MKKRIISALLAAAMAFTLLPSAAWAAMPIADENGDHQERAETPLGGSRGGAPTAEDKTTPTAPTHTSGTDEPMVMAMAASISYIDANGDPQTQPSATDIAEETTAWSTGWYVVSQSVTISSRITVSGTVNLILEDGFTLTANVGIGVPRGSSLTIYGQEEQSGSIVATGNNDNAGIGGTNDDGGAITINGGVIKATGGDLGAGIGGGYKGTNGAITINGGTVTATGNRSSSGIGSGAQCSNTETITITGGTVTANGGSDGAGIGGGDLGDGGTIIITGGTVTATGDGGGAGIGGGSADRILTFGGNGGTITIDGGNVTATGGDYGAGIGGGGQSGSGGTITINGGTVTATASGGSGIGSGSIDPLKDSSGGTIKITGGIVNATGSEYNAGIGGGEESSGGTVEITGGTVTANGDGGVGIGTSFSTGTEAGNAVIFASSISDESGKDSWSGIIFDGDTGEIYGTPTPGYNFEVPSGKTLNVKDGHPLHITKSVTMTNKGNVNIGGADDRDAVLDNDGKIINEGTIDVWGTLTRGETGITTQSSGQIVYHINLGITPPTFAEAVCGYLPPDAAAITIANHDKGVTVTITDVQLKGDGFTLNHGANAQLAPGDSDTSWTIQPNAGLSVGKHTATITVTYTFNGEVSGTATAEVTFTVNMAEGSGTSGDPYRIPDLATLEAVRDYINADADGGKDEYFELTAPIDMSTTYGADKDDTSWTPIGTSSNQFQGTFDGGGFEISGLYINTEEDYQGLFGRVSYSGAIKNLTVSGGVTGQRYAGGIVGLNSGVISDCISNCDVSGTYYTGGIAGGNSSSSGSIENCYNTGAISGSHYTGGIAGQQSSSGSIKNCYNTGTVTGKDQDTGGIAGSSTSSIQNCYNTGTVTGIDYTGGIVANNTGDVENCYNTGTVNVRNSGDRAGGIGYNYAGSIKNCYYLDTCGAKGQGTAKTEDAFQSGEVTWLLQDKQEPQVWGQTVGADYPALTGEEEKKVYQITGVVKDPDSIVWYSNREATLPAEPSRAGFIFDGWATEQGSPADFDQDFSVSKDMTVYAVWKLPFEGAGTALDPYRIPNLATLEAFRDYINDGNGIDEHFKLTENIDMSTTYGADKGEGGTSWTPIGTSSNQFQGTFDGDGREISGLYLSLNATGEEDSLGLFGESAGTICDLTVSGTILASDDGPYAGEIVGTNAGTVSGCTSAGSVTIEDAADRPYVMGAGGTAGGIAGSNTGTVTDCDSSAEIAVTVSSSKTIICAVGGIVGMSGSMEYMAEDAGEIAVKDCRFSGQVTGSISGDVMAAGFGGIVGMTMMMASDGAVEGCVNAGRVSGSIDSTSTMMGAGIGGIMGTNLAEGGAARVKNCVNTGEVSADGAGGVGGIVGLNVSAEPDTSPAVVERCYNTGAVTGTGEAVPGAVVGINAMESAGYEEPTTMVGEVVNCYYLSGGADGIGAGTGEAAAKNAEQFASGEVAWLLQKGQSAQVWGQKLSDEADDYPVLTSDGDKKVCKVTFATEGNENYAARYANPDGKVTLPKDPKKDNYTFVKWAKTRAADGEKFDEMTPVTEDMTVYAVGQANFGGESDPIPVSAAYGEGATLDLSKHMAYENGNDAKGKFTYTIEGEDSAKFQIIAGDILTVPKDLTAGEYTLTIKAEEKTPEYALMSVERYGTDPVTLTVKVSISKVAPTVTEPTALELTYTGAAQELVTAGETQDGTMQYSLDNADYSAEIPKGTRAKTYTVWYQVIGDANHTDTAPGQLTVTIAKAKAVVTETPTPTATGYTGEEIALVSGGASNFGSLVYSLTETGPFQAEAPTATEAGTYTVYYMVEGTDNWDASEVGNVQVEIHPADSSATVRRRTGLVYSGAAQALVTAGNVTGGQLVYALGEDAELVPASGYESRTPAATDAGTYYVWWKILGDVDHGDTDPTCITVTISPFPATFEPVAAETPYTGAAASVPVAQTAGQTPAIDPAKITVSYEQDGAAAEPVLPGTYDVLVAVTDPNFTLTGGAERVKVGTLTITHVHVYAEEWAHDESNHWHVCQGVGECDAPRSGQAAHAWDGGVVTQEPTVEAEGSRLYTCAVCGATKREAISKLDTFQISGAVTDQAGAPLPRAAVRLTRGSETVAETVTDDQGRYSFSSVPAGLYNVAATWADVTKTILVELSDADASQRDIQMPNGKVSSVVEVLGEDTPDVVVGGVDAIAEAEAASPAETVTVTLTVAKQEEPTDKEEIDQLIAGQKDDVLYLDVSLLKQINTQPTQAITDTGVRVLEIIVPYDFTGKRSVTVYRKHGDDPAAALTALAARPDLAAAEDGTFFADQENGWIAIYASKFSTYAIGYQTASAGSSSVARYVLTATAGEGGTIDPAGAVRVRRGADQSYAIRPEAGFEVANVLVDGASVGAVTAYTFENVAAAHTIQAIFQKAGADGLPFSDVAPGDWFYDSVREVYQRGLMQGVDATTFAPMQGATRATVVTILYRLAGSPATQADLAYADVSGDAWYAQAVRWAEEAGVAIGYGDGRFGPEDPITREQLAVMLWRYAAAQGRDVSVGEDTNILSYQDFDQIADWAIPGLQWAAGSGILRGTASGATLSPQTPATRAELATVLARYCESATLKETNEAE